MILVRPLGHQFAVLRTIGIGLLGLLFGLAIPCQAAPVLLDFNGATFSTITSSTAPKRTYKWAGIGTLSGSAFDLKVEESSSLLTAATTLGRTQPGVANPGTGQIRIDSTNATKRGGNFVFSFCDSTSGNPVTLPELEFSFLDIDNGASVSGAETIGIDTSQLNSGATLSVAHQGTDVMTDTSQNARFDLQYKSTTDSPNVTDPNSITQEQLDHTLGLSFTNVSEFEIRLTNQGTGQRFSTFSGIIPSLVPEPSAAVLLLPMVLVGALCRRRRR